MQIVRIFAMAGVCHKCANDLSGDYVTCQGFCDATFHVACCGFSSDLVAEVLRGSQMFWMCVSCSKLMTDIRFRKSVRSSFDSGQADASGILPGMIEQLKAEILSELKTEIRTNFTAIVNSSALTPKSSRRPPLVPALAQARKLSFRPNVNQRPKPDLMVGTSNSASPSHGVTVVPMAKEKLWIYLSRISKEVTPEQITALANKRLGTEDAVAIRLVAKGRDVSTFSYVSFKVGIDAELKDKALSSSTWPSGIVFRQFSDNRENFWRPDFTHTPAPVSSGNDPLVCSLPPENVMVIE